MDTDGWTDGGRENEVRRSRGKRERGEGRRETERDTDRQTDILRVQKVIPSGFG